MRSTSKITPTPIFNVNPISLKSTNLKTPLCTENQSYIVNDDFCIIYGEITYLFICFIPIITIIITYHILNN